MSLADQIPPPFGTPDECHLEAWPRKDANLDDVARVVGNVQWMIRDWLPRGFMTVIFGRPEQGKSGIALQTARHLLFGEPWPDGTPCEQVERIVWLETEGAEAILADRTGPWGIPLDRIVTPAPPEDPLQPCMIDNREHWARFTETVYRNPGLFVIDSIRGSHSLAEDARLNGIFKKISNLARDSKSSGIVIAHPRKADLKDPDAPLILDDLRGTGAFGGQARVVWAVERSMDGAPSVVRMIKSNLDDERHTLAFRMSDLGFQWEPVPKPTAEELKASDKAAAFLKATLLGKGRVPSADVDLKAKEAGFLKGNQDSTLKRVRKRLGVKGGRDGFGPGGTRWMELRTVEGQPIEGQS